MPYFTRTEPAADGFIGLVEDTAGQYWTHTAKTEADALAAAAEVAHDWNVRDFKQLCAILGQPDPYPDPEPVEPPTEPAA